MYMYETIVITTISVFVGLTIANFIYEAITKKRWGRAI